MLSMNLHPSLSADRISIEPLRPVEMAEVYSPCWCRSGRKYKWCHHRRERQEPINIFEVEQKFQKALARGYCSHPAKDHDACSGVISKAHTIQRKGGLSAIAEEGTVLTVKPIMKEMIATDGMPPPRKIGIGKASVFPGFCSKHDDALFKPVEGQSVELDLETAFLLSYRAIAYERFAKERQLQSIEVQREMDRGKPFFIQCAVQQQLHFLKSGIEVGMRDVESWKKTFDGRILTGRREDFQFAALRFDRTLPIVACTGFHPEFDFDGNHLQYLGRGAPEFDHIALTVTAFAGETIAVFGWIGEPNGPAGKLVDSFLQVPDTDKARALVRLLFVQSDNLFLRPSWWRSLPENVKNRLGELTQSGTTLRMRTGQDLSAADGPKVDAGTAHFASNR